MAGKQNLENSEPANIRKDDLEAEKIISELIKDDENIRKLVEKWRKEGHTPFEIYAMVSNTIAQDTLTSLYPPLSMISKKEGSLEIFKRTIYLAYAMQMGLKK